MSEIEGKIIKIMDPVTGEGKNGSWKKQEFIFETDGEYPRKICIANWNDKVSHDLLKVGEKLNVSINIESREYNSRWYTDVKAWRLAKAETETPVSAPPDYGNVPQDTQAPPEEDEGPMDDLPF